jgi:hypothetical protein
MIKIIEVIIDWLDNTLPIFVVPLAVLAICIAVTQMIIKLI